MSGPSFRAGEDVACTWCGSTDTSQKINRGIDVDADGTEWSDDVWGCVACGYRFEASVEIERADGDDE